MPWRGLATVACVQTVWAQKLLSLQEQEHLEFTVGGLEFSSDDLENQERISDWAARAFRSRVHLGGQAWDEVGEGLARLGRAAAEFPALALGVGMALHRWRWWQAAEGARLDVAAGREAAGLLRRSILHSGCDSPGLSLQNFLQRQCHVRWRYLLMIAAEISRYAAVSLRDILLAARVSRETSEYMQQVRALPFFRRYEGFGFSLQTPHDTNFNQDFFPQITYGPIWPKEVLPLGKFLESHFEDFLSDLQNMLDDGAPWDLHSQDLDAEAPFGPLDDDRQMLYLARHGTWSAASCRRAPRSCRLLRSRPELAACGPPSVGAGFLRLRPGARPRPRFGRAPRMSAHLGLVVPERGDVRVSAGGRSARWARGRATILDDTFAQSMSHEGTEPCYVLRVWFCHPCDSAPDNIPSYCIP